MIYGKKPRIRTYNFASQPDWALIGDLAGNEADLSPFMITANIQVYENPSFAKSLNIVQKHSITL